jgi:beta-glucosidase
LRLVYLGIPASKGKEMPGLTNITGSVDARPDNHEMDPAASPMESDVTNSTPNTQFSPPYSPQQKVEAVKDARLNAKKKLAQLSLEEKV